MSIQENVKKVVAWLIEEGYASSQRELAARLGYRESSFSQILNGHVPVSDKFLGRLKNLDGRIDIGWVKTGYGEMIDGNRVEVAPVSETDEEFVTENTTGARFFRRGGRLFMTVRHVPYAAYGQFANEADSLEASADEWSEETYEVDRVGHGHYLSFEVKGDSMDTGTRQSFEAGDRVLVRELGRTHWRDQIRFRDYPYWVVVFGSSVLLKQIIAQDIEHGILTFHSLNPSPEYADFCLSEDEIRSLYYVIRKKPKEIFF
jgi:phage repressor protein C with HTH and peptisase S24 domain